MNDCILVTGGAGFIGANFVLDWLKHEPERVVTLDLLTYAGNLGNLAPVLAHPRHRFVHGDIGDRDLVRDLLASERPQAVVHFAAESHVDRSITGPAEFITTNVEGTFALLDEARQYWNRFSGAVGKGFRFLHISTDEVYGSLGPDDPSFTEESPYAPRSPYAASKASADHLVRAYYHTYGFPALITHSSNNYGPRQYPEKLIPLMIQTALRGLPLPVYGDGANVRDWLYVTDNCAAISTVLRHGRVGESYNIGGRQEVANIEVVQRICAILDEVNPRAEAYASLIRFVPDRPGHDRRYAMNIGKIERELGWRPAEDFTTGLHKTINWYLGNLEGVQQVARRYCRKWNQRPYAAAGA